MEPIKFDDTVDQFFIKDSGPVYLVKQDGVVSEQTFAVVVQFVDSVPPGSNLLPATIGEDYSAGFGAVQFQFQNISQRLLVPFSLFQDNYPEGTEGFLMTSVPGDLGFDVSVPGYLPPTTLSADAFVIIEDDDG